MTPTLLPTMLVSTLAIVAAVAIIGLTDSDWADIGAVALLLGTLGVVLGLILRQLRDDESTEDPR